MSMSDASAPVPTKRLEWPAGLRPFRSVVWPGMGPKLDIERDWPELAFIALAVLLFWRGALPLADVPNAVEATQRAILHPVFGLPAALLGVTDGARFALLAGLLAAASGMWWLGVVLGLGRLGRLWVSLTYTFAAGVGIGWMIGRFGLDLGFAWIPWALACALLAVRQRRRLYAAGAAAALALVLLGGDFGLTCATTRRPGDLPAGDGHEPAARAALPGVSTERGVDRRTDRAAGLRSGRDPASAAIRRGRTGILGDARSIDRRWAWADPWGADRRA